jgi:hypothetical protein
MLQIRWIATLALVAGMAACDEQKGDATGGGAGSTTSGTGGGGEAGSGATGGEGGAPAGGQGGVAGAPGGSGGDSNPCEPLTGYDLDGAYAGGIGPYADEVGGFFGARLANTPLAEAIECNTLVVGIATFSNPDVCALPEEVGIAAWSDAGEAEAETGEIVPASAPAPTIHPLLVASKSTMGGYKEAGVYRFKGVVPIHFEAGQYPFVAVQLQPALCVASAAPVCEGSASLRYRPSAPGAGWSPLAHAKSDAPVQVPDLAGLQLVLGVEGCAPVAN